MSGQIVKVKREILEACMTCPLCNKLLKEATTIFSCLHTCKFFFFFSFTLSCEKFCVDLGCWDCCGIGWYDLSSCFLIWVFLVFQFHVCFAYHGLYGCCDLVIQCREGVCFDFYQWIWNAILIAFIFFIWCGLL